MSVTIAPITNGRPFDTSLIDSPCLCAQMAESFCDAMDAGRELRAHAAIVADLAANADADCHMCLGTGIDPNGYDPEGNLEMNFANGTWRVLSNFLGLKGFTGQVSVAAFRAAIVRAAKRLDGAPTFGAELEYAEERSGASGAARYIRGEITADGLIARVARLSAFLDTCEERGATHIAWG